MANSGGKITAPVSIDDVRTVLGQSSYDLGTLCKASTINIFSRVKPVRYNSMAPITDANRRSAGHGVDTPDIVTGTTVTAALIQDAAGNWWEYNAPRGGTYNEPFRLTDFIGYYHYAVPPIQINYPESGWEINNTANDWLNIYIDYDPADSTYNLQATDLTVGLDFRQCYIYAALCRYNDAAIGVYSTSEPILDSAGELNAPFVRIPISGLSQMNASSRYRIYMVLAYFSGGRWNLVPFPRSGNYNPNPMYLNVIRDASEGGGGIEDITNDIAFSPSFTSAYYVAGDCIEEEGGRYVMRNTTGDLLVQCKLTNSSSSSYTWKRSDFSVTNNYSTTIVKYATNIWTSKPASASGGVTQFTIPAKGSITMYAYFEGVLSNVKSTATNTTVEIEFNRSGNPLINGALNYCYGSLGWLNK